MGITQMTVISQLLNLMLALLNFSYAALQAPNVTISASPVGTAGQQHNLTCTATVDDYLEVTSTLMWSLPDITLSDTVFIREYSISPTSRTLTLSFNPLHTSHGGFYMCKSAVVIDDFDALTQSVNLSLRVQSNN